MEFTPGIYTIYKTKGPSSFKIIAQLRRMTGIKRIGHAGTLDPLASGVLVVAIGREFTKQLTELTLNDKEYIATIKLGVNSTTDDAEGEKTIIFSPLEGRMSSEQTASPTSGEGKDTQIEQIPDEQTVQQTLQSFIGQTEQVPPVYSAIKINGQPAYKKARKGQTLELKARTVEIFSIELLEYNYPILKIKVHCGKGVYIRSLARDIGEKLETGAYMSDLERTRVGKFTIEQAINIESFKNESLNTNRQSLSQ